MNNRKPIKTTSTSRFLKSEYVLDNQAMADYHSYKLMLKKDVNTCNHCGIKFWNEKRCKCNII